MAITLVPPSIPLFRFNFILNYLSIFFLPIKSFSQRIMPPAAGAGPASGEGAECVICLCRIEDGERVHEMRCEHVFHKSCMERWLQNKGRTCPLCRDNLFSCSKVSSEGGVETILIDPFVHDDRDAWWIR